MRLKDLKYLEIQSDMIFTAIEKAWKKYRHRLELLPASFSGHYHPPGDSQVGGLKIHIQNVCWFIDNYCTELNKTVWAKDVLMASAFFHDIGSCEIAKIEFRLNIVDQKIIKREHIITRDNDEFHYHPLRSAEIAEFYLTKAGVGKRTINVIKRIVESHMSHWCPDLPQPKTDLELAFSLADFMVTRKAFRIEIES